MQNRARTLLEVQHEVATQVLRSPTLQHLSGKDRVQHAVCGLVEEAGEVAGLLKREHYKNQVQDETFWVEELGDTLWYLAEAANALGLSLEYIFEYNCQKLEKRYGR